MKKENKLIPTTKDDYYENISLDFFNESFDESIFNFLDNELKIGYSNYDEFKCEYDLSYSQGSFFEFSYLSSDILKKILKKEFSNNYKRYSIEFSNYKKDYQLNKKYWFEIEFSKNGSYVEDEDLEDEIRTLIMDEIKYFERSCFEMGRKQLEYQEKEEQFRNAFIDFKKLNSIESDEDFFEFNYSEEEEKGYTKIWGGQYDELWVQLPNLITKTREENYLEFSF